MKSVVCFGDSNTYGHNPVNGDRLPESVRWPCLLQNLLGDGFKVIEEGLNGRTTVFDDPNDDWKNGLDYIKGILCTHRPVDYLIIMLGTNDMKTVYNASLDEIAAGLNEIVQRAEKVMDLKQGYVPKILIVSPPEITTDIAAMVRLVKQEKDIPTRRTGFKSKDLARGIVNLVIDGLKK